MSFNSFSMSLKQAFTQARKEDAGFPASFMMAAAQELESCELFVADLRKHQPMIQLLDLEDGDYALAKVDVSLLKPKEERLSDTIGDSYASHHYRLTFLCKPMYGGYCECLPTHEGYDEEHQCCGKGCDWDVPFIRIERIEELDEVSFKGIERDLWAYQRAYEIQRSVDEADLKRQETEQKIKRIEEEMARNKRQLDQLKQSLQA